MDPEQLLKHLIGESAGPVEPTICNRCGVTMPPRPPVPLSFTPHGLLAMTQDQICQTCVHLESVATAHLVPVPPYKRPHWRPRHGS